MITTLKLLRFLGPTLLFFGTFVVLPPLLMSYLDNALDNNMLWVYLSCITYSLIILLTLRRKKFSYTPRDGFIITFFTWTYINHVKLIDLRRSNINRF